jgi:hypothetical protein
MNADTEARYILDSIEDAYPEGTPPPVVAYVRRLEQRIAAARTHIDRARQINNDEPAGFHPPGLQSELVMALDVLNGEAGA